MSYAEFPSKSYYQKLFRSGKLDKYLTHYGRNITFEMARKSLVSLYIYFDELDFTQISEQEATSLVVLISNIGGALGLFVGVSMLSILELVDLFVSLVTLPIRVLLRRKYFSNK